MKKKDLALIKGSTLKELTEKLTAIQKEIAGLTMDKNMKKLKDLKSISKKRKDAAQVLTLISGKQLLANLENRVEVKGDK